MFATHLFQNAAIAAFTIGRLLGNAPNEDFKICKAMSNAPTDDFKLVLHAKIYTLMSSRQRSYRKTHLPQIKDIHTHVLSATQLSQNAASANFNTGRFLANAPIEDFKIERP